jgi:hypothetical protein
MALVAILGIMVNLKWMDTRAIPTFSKFSDLFLFGFLFEECL